MAFVFAQLDGDGIIAPDPKFDGPYDCEPWPCSAKHDFTSSIRNSEVYPRDYSFVLLVPESPIYWAPGDTFWERVAQLPPVEYRTGYWDLWEVPSLLPAVANSDDDYVSVFVVAASQYEMLNEACDRVTDIRRKHFTEIKSQSPSAAATPPEFRLNLPGYPFQFGRPRNPKVYPIPISLLQPEFARFQDDLRSIPLDPSLSPLGVKFVHELSQLFATEAERKFKFHELIAALLGPGVKVAKREILNYTTDGVVEHLGVVHLPAMPEMLEVKIETTVGSSDLIFQIILYYMEAVRVVTSDDEYKGEWRQTRLPSVLIVHNGPNIQILGAVWLGRGSIEVLSHSIPLYFSPYNHSMMEDLFRFLCALKRLSQSICEIYKNPTEHAVDAEQITFPYPRTYPANIPLGSLANPPVVRFSYTGRVCDLRLVFTARNDSDIEIIVKFGTRRYGVEAHEAAAAAGIAPELLSFQELPGSMWMVVMQPLPEGFVPCFEVTSTASCRRAIQDTVTRFHKLGFVHGDLREGNVFVRQREEDKWDCLIIDFDWAGRDDDDSLKYPLAVYITDQVWRPRAHMDGEVITADDDVKTMEEFLNRQAKKIRRRH